MSYAALQLLGKAVHGTKICEGNIWEDQLFKAFRDSGRFPEVSHGKPITLPASNEIKKGERRKHKVDIFCKNDAEKNIFAFNSKGKSFNNTESPESLLAEYNRYKKGIELENPGFSVVYAVLKDEYDGTDLKMNFLKANGIPVYNTASYMNETLGISTEVIEGIEAKRQSMVMALIKERFKESGLTVEQVTSILTGV